jgi:hypothetical protein
LTLKSQSVVPTITSSKSLTPKNTTTRATTYMRAQIKRHRLLTLIWRSMGSPNKMQSKRCSKRSIMRNPRKSSINNSKYSRALLTTSLK